MVVDTDSAWATIADSQGPNRVRLRSEIGYCAEVFSTNEILCAVPKKMLDSPTFNVMVRRPLLMSWSSMEEVGDE